LLSAGNREVTKKLRLTQAEADLLAKLARIHDTSQSEVLRRGLRALDRVRQRQENVDRLLALAEADGEKVPFELGS